MKYKEQRPAVPETHTGRLTTNDSKIIEAAMRNHTIHPQGRDSHNLNKYIWRFIALSTAQPRVITIEATSEQEARQQSPAGCVMVFAARIRQGCTMCNNTRPDAAAEAIKTLIDALIDISVIADRAHKHATSETEYAGAFVPHSLAVMQLSADMALNEASKIIMADMEVVSHE
ncbi:host cell division inhibitor Icd-like protein [Escherichia coli]|nr:host cell division inhibitor Icd-like protein [Escherichia coli]